MSGGRIARSNHEHLRIWWILSGMVLTLGCGVVERSVAGLTATTPPAPPATAAPTKLAPAYVPPECQGVALPTIDPALAGAPTLTADGGLELTLDEQWVIARDVLRTVEQVYADPARLGAEWQAAAAALDERIEAGLDTETFYAELQALISVLGDEHSHFESPVEVEASNAALAGAAEQVGIGVLAMGLPEAGLITLLQVYDGSPAAMAGLQPHDNLLAIDGAPVVQTGIPQPWRLRGPECTMLVVSVATPGEPARPVAVVRHRYSVDQVIDVRMLPTANGARIGYIFLPSFFDARIPEQMEIALDGFGPLDGLVIDNRMNGGGSSSVLEPVLSLFASGDVGEYLSQTASRPLHITPSDVQGSQSIPLVVLIGEDTVSYGEVFAGVLQDLGRARLVGQTTAGNVETLHGYTFDDGSRLWIAEERFVPAVSLAGWEGIGVQPDVEVVAPWHTFKAENDPAVAAAIQLLTGD